MYSLSQWLTSKSRCVYVVYIGGTYGHIGEELIFLDGIEANH